MENKPLKALSIKWRLTDDRDDLQVKIDTTQEIRFTVSQELDPKLNELLFPRPRLWRWQGGRQNKAGYRKMLIYQFQRLRCDCYLLEFDPECLIQPHRDPAPAGYDHLRLNIVLRGGGILGIFLTSDAWHTTRIGRRGFGRRWPVLNASGLYHDYENDNCRTLILSFGWLRRKK